MAATTPDEVFTSEKTTTDYKEFQLFKQAIADYLQCDTKEIEGNLTRTENIIDRLMFKTQNMSQILIQEINATLDAIPTTLQIHKLTLLKNSLTTAFSGYPQSRWRARFLTITQDLDQYLEPKLRLKSQIENFSYYFEAWVKNKRKSINASDIHKELEHTFNVKVNVSPEKLSGAILDEIKKVLSEEITFEQFVKIYEIYQLLYGQRFWHKNKVCLDPSIHNLNNELYTCYRLEQYLKGHREEVIIAKFRELYKESLSGNKDALRRRIEFGNVHIKPESAIGSFLINQLPGTIPPGDDPSKFIDTQKQKEINIRYLLQFWVTDLKNILACCVLSNNCDVIAEIEKLMSHLICVQHLYLDDLDIRRAIIDTLGKIIWDKTFNNLTACDRLKQINCSLITKIQASSTGFNLPFLSSLISADGEKNKKIYNLAHTAFEIFLQSNYSGECRVKYDYDLSIFIFHFKSYIDFCIQHCFQHGYLDFSNAGSFKHNTFFNILHSFYAIKYKRADTFFAILDQAFPQLDENTYLIINKIASNVSLYLHNTRSPLDVKELANLLYAYPRHRFHNLFTNFLSKSKINITDLQKIIIAAVMYIHLKTLQPKYDHVKTFAELKEIMLMACNPENATWQQIERIHQLFIHLQNFGLKKYKEYNPGLAQEFVVEFSIKINFLYLTKISQQIASDTVHCKENYLLKIRLFILGHLQYEQLNGFNDVFSSGDYKVHMFAHGLVPKEAQKDLCLYFIKQELINPANHDILMSMQQAFLDRYNQLVQQYTDLYFRHLFFEESDKTIFDDFRNKMQYEPAFLLRGSEMQFAELQELEKFEVEIQSRITKASLSELPTIPGTTWNYKNITDLEEGYKRNLSTYLCGSDKNCISLQGLEMKLTSNIGILALLRPDEKLSTLTDLQDPFKRDQRMQQYRQQVIEQIAESFASTYLKCERVIQVPQLHKSSSQDPQLSTDSLICKIAHIDDNLEVSQTVQNFRRFIQSQIEGSFATYIEDLDSVSKNSDLIASRIPYYTKVWVILGVDLASLQIPPEHKKYFEETINSCFSQWCHNICVIMQNTKSDESVERNAPQPQQAHSGYTGAGFYTDKKTNAVEMVDFVPPSPE